MTPQTPHCDTAPYKAAEYLYREGPKTEAELLATVTFGTPSNSAARLQAAIDSGWLDRTVLGTVDCGDTALEHFAKKPQKYVGEVAGPRRVDVLHCKAYVPPKRFVRADAMDNSLVAMPSHFARESA